MTITYRPATPDDVAALVDIGRRSFVDTFGHLYSAQNLTTFLDEAHTEEGWREELVDPAFSVRLAFAADGALAAYCKTGPASFPIPMERPAVELRQIYVLTPWQGTGIAQEMLAWAIADAKARGAADLYLSVYVDNHRARRFYDRHGFVEVGKYVFMVGTHEDDDRIMKLDLTA